MWHISILRAKLIIKEKSKTTKITFKSSVEMKNILTPLWQLLHISESYVDFLRGVTASVKVKYFSVYSKDFLKRLRT